MEQENNVKVAVRVRPQLPKEVIDRCHICTRVAEDEPQVWLGTDKAFTYDHVFDTNSRQEQVYTTCVEKLIEGCFDGFNATVLAYGQTGSGKTFTMGSGFDMMGSSGEGAKGIIPRAVEHLFQAISKRQNEARERGEPVPEFKVNAQFMELYNEDINDLLGDERSKHSQIKIHEDSKGQIYTVGVTTKPVSSVEETNQCLRMGALSRTTASTQMNAQSSRSHAIFTLHIKQHRVVKIDPALFDNEGDDNKESGMGHAVNGLTADIGVVSDIGSQEFETLTAKFHFVDLAGSERLKRTGATGERAREGISINSGLLALGNVISALGDKSKHATHVPYRDSKLTRLLQDSLGGNSMTLMIACISPSDRDFMETLNTLRYANRAKNIKNKVTANQDKSSQTINILRREIQQLQIELQEYKQGKRLVDSDGTEKINDMYHENMMLQTEINNLKTRIKALQETHERLTARNVELLSERETGAWIKAMGDDKADIGSIVKGYMKEIEELRTQLMELEETCSVYRKQLQRNQAHRLSFSPVSAVAMSGGYDIGLDAENGSTSNILEEAKKDVARIKRLTRTLGNKTIKGESLIADTNGNELNNQINNEKNGVSEMEALEEQYEDEEADGEQSDESENEEENDIDDDINHVTLVELTNEIGIKEKLILELEKTTRKMNALKQQYEEKLCVLQARINETEQERDKVMSKFNAVGNVGDEKAKKVKDEYESKLNGLTLEMKRLQVAQREHNRSMKIQSAYENQMKALRSDVAEMKRQKVKLLDKIKEDAKKHKEEYMRNSKKIAQLAKQERQKDLKIRNLEVESNRYKGILKRKDDEVNALKRQIKPMSDRVAGRAPNSSRMLASARGKLPFSPVAAKNKWHRLHQNINKLVLSKQSVAAEEKQMERFMQQRQQLERQCERIKNQIAQAKLQRKNNLVQSLSEEKEMLIENIKYVNDRIEDIQSTILQLEETNKDGDTIDTTSFFDSINGIEIRYVFDKVVAMAVSQALLASQKEDERNEYEMKYKQVTDNSLIQEQLLNHVLETTFIHTDPDNPTNFDDFNATFDTDFSSHPIIPPSTSSSDQHQVQHQLSIPMQHQHGQSNEKLKAHKARRLTKTPQELLFETSLTSHSEGKNGIKNGQGDSNVMTQSLVAPILLTTNEVDIPRVPSAPSLKDSPSFTILPIMRDLSFHSPSFKRKTYERLPLIEPSSQARNQRSRTSPLSCSGNCSSILNQPLSYASRQLSTEFTDSTPPNSPPVSRRIRDDNDVFSRLTSGTIANNQINSDRIGHITPFTGRPSYDKSGPLVCTHVAEGHTRAVLSVVATNDVLFSGSKDCSVKIWDLHTGQEVQSLTEHPDAVQVVRYNEYSRLAYSVSKSFIKVWDPRDNPARCIKTLNSSGLVSNSGYMNSTKSIELAPGEATIHDIQLSTYGTTLFSTCSRIIRVWDLRMYHCIGKLNTGHQAPIMCMAVEEAGVDNNIVITGSKDHYIKLFEVTEGVGGIHNPKMTLKPPHYDGIESLKIHGDFLFSGSRDACIKKWDLPNQRLVQSLNYCHKDWIQALTVYSNSNTLLSGCRSGQLKLWNIDTCQMIGDIKAHSSAIHCIDTNSALIFTASADNTINLWRWRSSTDPSPDYNSDINNE